MKTSSPLIHFAALLLLPGASPAVITWDGSTSGNWDTSANWDLNRVPNTLEQVIFPAAGANKTMTNNRPAATSFQKLTFSGSGYSVGGNSVNMTDALATLPAIEATHTSGSTALNFPITVGELLTISCSAGGTLALNATADITLGTNNLTLSAAGTIDVNSTISGSGSVTIQGGGVTRMDAVQNHTGGTAITATGELVLTSTLAGNVSVSSGGQIDGSGTIGGNLEVAGVVAPGESGPGRLTVNGNLLFSAAGAGDEARFDLTTTAAATGYDQIRVGGAVTANSCRIVLNPTTAFPVGTVFVLIDKTSAGAIGASPVFAYADASSIAEGSIKVAGVNAFRFSYTGGDGNDFTATVVAAPVATTRTWDGGGSGLQWSEAANWTGDTVPTAGQVLNFGGSATPDVATVNNLGGNFGRLDFTGTVGGFSIAPVSLTLNDLTLTAGIVASNTGAANTVNNDLVLAAAQTYALTGGAALTIGGGTSTQLNGFDLTLNVAPTSGTPQLNLNSSVSGTGNLIKTGAGLAVISGVGTSSNSYTGTTTVQQGELRLSRTTITAPANCIPGALIIGGGANPAQLTTTVTEKIANTADVTVNANGSYLPGANETIGSLTINGGTVNAGVHSILLNGNLTANVTSTISASSLEFIGATKDLTTASGVSLSIPNLIATSGANTTLRKMGPGTLVLDRFNVGLLDLVEGVIDSHGADDLGTELRTQPGTRLRGIGEFNVLNATAGGSIEPGFDTVSDEMQTFDFNAGTATIYRPYIDATGSSALTVKAGLNLGGAQLVPNVTAVPAVGTVFTILYKTTAGVTATRFKQGATTLNEGSILTTPLAHFQISYAGGDITLTAVTPAASGTTRVWDGGGANVSWTTAANWVGDVAPQPGDSLEFPAGVHVSSTNNFPAGMGFHSISFTGAASTTAVRGISGNAIRLTGGLSSSVTDSTARNVQINLPVRFLNAVTVTNSGDRRLLFQQAVTADGATLQFAGPGTASQRQIQFSGAAALLGGPAQVRVVANASLELGNFLHTYAGGSVVEFGNLIGQADPCVRGGLTVGLGTSVATANIFSVTGTTLADTITVNSQGTLALGGSLTIGQLALNDGSLSGAVTTLTVNGDVALNGTDALTLQNLTCTGLSSTGPVVGVTNLTCTTLGLSGGAHTVPNIVLSGNATLSGGASLASTLIKFPGTGTSTFNVAGGTTVTVATLGDAALAGQNVILTGGGLITVGTRLATDSLTVTGGSELRQNGDIPSIFGFDGMVQINGGRLSGTGLTNTVTAGAGGAVIAPGASPGVLSVAGGLSLNAASSMVFEINGPLPGAGYDQVATGSPLLNGAALQVTLAPSYTPLTGQEFVLINHSFDNAVFPASFAGISEGSTATLATGVTVRYSYTGGDGNDFSATVTSSPAGSFRVWDGGGANAGWMTAANWLGDVAPQAGEAILFPSGAAQTTNTNNFPAGTAFRTLRVEGPFTLNGNQVQLTGDLTANLTSPATLNLPVFMANDGDFAAEIHLDGSGGMSLPGGITVATEVQLTLRRTDSSGVFDALDVFALQMDAGASGIGVFIEGGGRVRFNPGTRNYDRPTEVMHGILQIAGASGGVPGDLFIGGGIGPAVVENPGGSEAGVGRIPDGATLKLLPNGTHTLTGATPVEEVFTLIYAGGSRVESPGAKFRVEELIEVQTGTSVTVGGATVFSFPGTDVTDTIAVQTGASMHLTGTITGDSFQSPVLEKFGGGPLLVSGTLSGAQLRIREGLVAPVGSGGLSMPVVMRGGILGGNGTVSSNLSGGTEGGIIAPGGATGTGTGSLTVFGNFLPVPQTTLAIELGGTTAGARDQLTVHGASIDLNSCALSLSLVNGFTPTPGQTFTILDKTSAGTIIRTFGGRAEGSTFPAAGFNWTISYTGGSGNDVVLTAGTAAVAADLKFGTFSTSAPVGGGAGQRVQATINGGAGAANATVTLQFSDNLQSWTSLTSNPADGAGNVSFDVVDTLAGPRRFYRAIIP